MNDNDDGWPLDRPPSELLAEVRRRANVRRARRAGVVSVVALLLLAPLALVIHHDNGTGVQANAGPPRTDARSEPRGTTSTTSTMEAGGAHARTSTSIAPDSPLVAARAPEVGITEDEIRIGNVSTLPNALSTNSASSVAAAKAVVAYQNSIGGMWGRTLVLDVHDDLGLAPRNRSETAAALDDDFALLGSRSTQDGASADVVASSGAPDTSQASTAERQLVANNFSVEPFDIDRAATTPFVMFRTMNGDATHEVATFVLDEVRHRRIQSARMAAATTAGWRVTYTRTVEPTESDFTADIVKMRQMGVRTVYVAALQWQQAVTLAGAMRQQNFTPDFFITEGESALQPSDPGAEHVYVPSLVDPGGSDEYALFRTWLAKVAPGITADEPAAQAWAEGRLLFQAMEQAGPKASRRDVVHALEAIHSFSANGLIATADPPSKNPSTCVVVTQNDGDHRARVAPSKGFACDGVLKSGS